MKKSLIALAALAVVSVASAQSTVTISGNMSAGQSSVAGVKTISGLDATNSNLVNFNATEDLGGGLKATANIGIRFDVNMAATQTAFGKSTGDQFVELSSATLGAIRAGTFTSYSAAPYSAFATWSTRTDSEVSATSVNQVRYASPRISGFAVNLSAFTPFKAAVAVSDVGVTPAVAQVTGATGDKTQESGTQVLATYVNGPLTVGFSQTDFAVARGGKGAELRTIDGTYDFGVAKLFVQTWEGKAVTTGSTNNKGYGISANIPYQAFTFKVGMRKFDDKVSATTSKDRTSLGVTYALSKRTTLLALLAKDKTIATTPVKTTNTYLGASHSF
jgi:predicted porin